MKRIYKAIFIDTPSLGQLRIYNPGFLTVTEDGKIENFSDKIKDEELKIGELIDFGNRIVVPGFIDTHTHLSQHAFAGIGGPPLLPWLQTYTFPQELRFNDADIARKEASIFFDSCLKLGTTTVVAYVTSNTEATNIAFEEAQKSGIRAWIGKVLMDEGAPTGLLQNTDLAIEENEKLIQKWLNNHKLSSIISPRFALSCSRGLMREAAKQAAQFDLFIQTHLSENNDEILAVQKSYSEFNSYTDLYYKMGLLGSKTLLGHCIHLVENEKKLLIESKSVVVHCPSSNRFLASGSMELKKYLQEGIRVSLGSDVAAGYSLSMANEAKEAIETSKIFKNPLQLGEALYLATHSGAKALGISHKCGWFNKGNDADFVVINDYASHPLMQNNLIGNESQMKMPYNSPEHRLARIFYRFSADSIERTYVSGVAHHILS